MTESLKSSNVFGMLEPQTAEVRRRTLLGDVTLQAYPQ